MDGVNGVLFAGAQQGMVTLCRGIDRCLVGCYLVVVLQ